MSYEIKTAILDPKTGYNKVAADYHLSRSHLNSFEKGLFLRFLPRNIESCDILDLGAGNGRMHSFFPKYSSYTACDIAEKLLAKHPGGPNVHKVACDLEQKLPFESLSFDVVLTFFVLEHINDIDQLFSEIERTMKPGAIRIIGHFKQRRAYEFHHGKDRFKIERYTYGIEQIQKLAEYNFLTMWDEPIFEDGIHIGDVIVLTKNP